MLIVVFIDLMQTFAAHTGEMQASKIWQAGPASSENTLPVFPYHPYMHFPPPSPSPPHWMPRNPAALFLPCQGLYVPQSLFSPGPSSHSPPQGLCATAEQMAAVPCDPHLQFSDFPSLLCPLMPRAILDRLN